MIDPFFGGLITGGISLASNLFGQGKQNEFNQQMLQQQQNYQTEMSNTAYQRASADMQKAGLNPMMMFGSGGPASSPTIQPAQKTSAISNIGGSIEKAISSAVAMKTFDRMTDEIANLKEENLRIKAGAYQLRQSGDLATVTARSTDAQERLRRESLPIVINEALEAKNESELRKTTAGKVLDAAGLAGRKASDVVSPVGNLINSAVRARRGLSSHNFDMRWP